MHVPVRIVLVETSHPGNIGASARAMKTMGLDELVLVAPRSFPSAEATARASGADDILARVRTVDSLPAAIADCGFVAGASARPRRLSWPVADPRDCAATLWRRAGDTPVALIFGPEHSGLTNEDLGRCNQVVRIPANPAYGSLNVAMAVQILCYELRLAAPGHAAARAAAPSGAPAARTPKPTGGRFDERGAHAAAAPEPESRPSGIPAASMPPEAPPATAAEREGFYRHLESALSAAGFLNPDHPRQLKLRLRRIFQRNRLDRTEVNILRGVVGALQGGPAAAGRDAGGAIEDGRAVAGRDAGGALQGGPAAAGRDAGGAIQGGPAAAGRDAGGAIEDGRAVAGRDAGGAIEDGRKQVGRSIVGALESGPTATWRGAVGALEGERTATEGDDVGALEDGPAAAQRNAPKTARTPEGTT